MSAKGRKPQPPNPQEFFPTPDFCVDSLLESKLLQLPGGTWIEPCAGKGNIIQAVNRHRDDVNWIIVEVLERFQSPLREIVRPGRDVLVPANSFLSMMWGGVVADVLIMNPPFSLTMPFLAHAFERARWVVCLQRKAFFGSQTRAEWFRRYCPDDYTIWKRPSFSQGGTDQSEYSWFVWPPDPFGRTGEESRLRRVGRLAMLDKPALATLADTVQSRHGYSHHSERRRNLGTRRSRRRQARSSPG